MIDITKKDIHEILSNQHQALTYLTLIEGRQKEWREELKADIRNIRSDFQE